MTYSSDIDEWVLANYGPGHSQNGGVTSVGSNGKGPSLGNPVRGGVSYDGSLPYVYGPSSTPGQYPVLQASTAPANPNSSYYQPVGGYDDGRYDGQVSAHAARVAASRAAKAAKEAARAANPRGGQRLAIGNQEQLLATQAKWQAQGQPMSGDLYDRLMQVSLERNRLLGEGQPDPYTGQTAGEGGGLPPAARPPSGGGGTPNTPGYLGLPTGITVGGAAKAKQPWYHRQPSSLEIQAAQAAALRAT